MSKDEMKIIVHKFGNVRAPKKNIAWTLRPSEKPQTVTRLCGQLAIEAGLATEVPKRAPRKKNPAPSPAASAEPEGEASPEKKEQ